MQHESTRGVGPNLGLEVPGEILDLDVHPVGACATRNDGSGEPRHLSSPVLAGAPAI
jgi:hypothetical protein